MEPLMLSMILNFLTGSPTPQAQASSLAAEHQFKMDQCVITDATWNVCSKASKPGECTHPEEITYAKIISVMGEPNMYFVRSPHCLRLKVHDQDLCILYLKSEEDKYLKFQVSEASCEGLRK